jgi:hypothetical protein
MVSDNVIDYNAFTNIPSFHERLDYLTTLDLSDENQPHCILQYFDDISTQLEPFECAAELAFIFKQKCGPIIIEAESSYCLNRYLTIVDEIENAVDEGYFDELLLRAFRIAGIKHAHECDEYDLRMLYLEQGYPNHFREESLDYIDDFHDFHL